VNITYIIGRNKIAQITVKNGTEQELYFTYDGHGSTRVLTDLAGAILELYAFDAYGNAIGFDPSVALTEFLYSGEQFDSKIGQQYLRARYYDPTTGRFNRIDPFFGNLDDPLSLHKYLYCHDDPINGVDTNGEFFLPIIILASLLGGVTISGLVTASMFDSNTIIGGYGWGVIQGYANIANGIQDFGIGIYDLAAHAENFQIYVITLGQSRYYWPILTSPDWSREIFVHEYGDELEGWEKWFCDTHNWSKFIGSSGAITLVTIGASSTVTAFSRSPARGVPESANYVQKTFSPSFSQEGRFAGKTVDSLAAEIRAGKISPKEVPIEIAVTENGNTLILNTRSAQALTKAGIPRSQWNAMVINDDVDAMNRLAGQLARNKLSLDGIANPIGK
jgi:RHS repeat-associated protein